MEKTLAAEKPLQVVEAETASSPQDEPLCGPVEPVADRPNRAEAEEAVRTLIKWAGDDPDREGLLDTPGRVVRSYEEFYDGYEADPKAILARTFEETDGYDEIVLLRSIRFESHCEHHMAPIIGHAHIGYLPDHRVVGVDLDDGSRRFEVDPHIGGIRPQLVHEGMQRLCRALLIEEHPDLRSHVLQRTPAERVLVLPVDQRDVLVGDR